MIEHIKSTYEAAKLYPELALHIGKRAVARFIAEIDRRDTELASRLETEDEK